MNKLNCFLYRKDPFYSIMKDKKKKLRIKDFSKLYPLSVEYLYQFDIFTGIEYYYDKKLGLVASSHIKFAKKRFKNEQTSHILLWKLSNIVMIIYI